jgi:hypothetical protein
MAKMTPQDLCRSGAEHGEQSALFCWVNDAATREAFPALFNAAGRSKLFAVNNNAGTGDAIRGARAKMAGVQPGVADLFLPLARHGVNGLFLEMKQRKFKDKKGGGLQEVQTEFRAQCFADGFGFAVAYGWEEASQILRQYLS